MEIIAHSFYFITRNKYKFAIDFGTNIGIDAIVLHLLGSRPLLMNQIRIYCLVRKRSKKLNKLKHLELYPYGILDKNKNTKIY